METNTAIRIAALGAIFEVPFDRTTDGSQLTADLMMPPGLKIDFQERVMFTFR